MAWLAVVAEAFFAPLVIFPLLVGVLLGFLLVAVVRLAQVGNRATVILGVVPAVALTVAGQHYLGYLKAYSESSGQIQKQGNSTADFGAVLKQFTPSFPEYMQRQAAVGRRLLPGYTARGWVAWLSWAVDGLLVLAAALALVIPAVLQPYCNRCRSWYRVVRSGRIDVPTARRLARLAGMPEGETPKGAGYRLLSCNAACGPTDFELNWREAGGGASTSRAWLDTDQRNRVAQVLDASGKPRNSESDE